MCQGPGVGRSRVGVQKGEAGAVSEGGGWEVRTDGKVGPSPRSCSDPLGKVVFKATMPLF